MNFAKFLKNAFFAEHVWATASGNKHPQFFTEATSEVVLKNNRDFGTAFPVNIAKFFKNDYLYRTLPLAAFVFRIVVL